MKTQEYQYKNSIQTFQEQSERRSQKSERYQLEVFFEVTVL